MSSSIFRQIGSGSRSARAERLFRAAVTAFCALTRPGKAEIAQLDDLTLSLLRHVSAPCLRFAAAALSDSPAAPPGLVRRLCEEDVEIAAPLLARSPILDDAELLGLMERHGLPHARVIARRQQLSSAVADGVQALFQAGNPEAGEAVENARRKLRGMMRGAPDAAAPPRPEGGKGYEHLRDTALLDHRPFFHTALADALGVDLAQARRIAGEAATLLPALHGLGLSAEQAFLVIAAGWPDAVQDRSDVRAVLDGFAELEALSAGDAADPKQEAAALPATAAVFRFKRA